jgi:hypothetical protein
LNRQIKFKSKYFFGHRIGQKCSDLILRSKRSSHKLNFIDKKGLGFNGKFTIFIPKQQEPKIYLVCGEVAKAKENTKRDESTLRSYVCL